MTRWLSVSGERNKENNQELDDVLESINQYQKNDAYFIRKIKTKGAGIVVLTF